MSLNLHISVTHTVVPVIFEGNSAAFAGERSPTGTIASIVRAPGAPPLVAAGTVDTATRLPNSDARSPAACRAWAASSGWRIPASSTSATSNRGGAPAALRTGSASPQTSSSRPTIGPVFVAAAGARVPRPSSRLPRGPA